MEKKTMVNEVNKEKTNYKASLITRKIALIGILTALYVVLSFTVKIPLISHIQTDLGYIAFGVACASIGVPALIVGVLGSLFISLLTSGWVPIGWMLGQVLIGIICGLSYRKVKNMWANIGITILAVFLGVAVIKTIVECNLYNIPLVVKFPKNTIAFIADTIPMIIGYLIATKTAIKQVIMKLHKKEVENGKESN